MVHLYHGLLYSCKKKQSMFINWKGNVSEYIVKWEENSRCFIVFMVCKPLCNKGKGIRIYIFVSAWTGIRKHWRKKNRIKRNRGDKDKVEVRLFSVILSYFFDSELCITINSKIKSTKKKKFLPTTVQCWTWYILISCPYLKIFSESRPNIEVPWTCFLCMKVNAYFIDFAAGTVIAKLELYEMCAYTPQQLNLFNGFK